MQSLFQSWMWGPILAVGIPAALLSLALLKSRREDRELDRRIACGPGCLCGGEGSIRATQPAPVYLQAPQPQPQMIYLQAPQPQPQIIYLQAPQPQAPAIHYLPGSQVVYQADPLMYPQQAPQSYYPGPEPAFEERQPHHLPPQRVKYLPAPRMSDLIQAHRREQEGRRPR